MARSVIISSVCSGSKRVIAANNDAKVRIFDAENFSCLNRFSYDWSVNVSAPPEIYFIEVFDLDC